MPDAHDPTRLSARALERILEVTRDLARPLDVGTMLEHVIDGVVVRSSYAHMQSGSMTLSMGDTVERGQVLGLVGNTGQSFGAHLHFTIQNASGTFINPLTWMREHVNIGHDQ